MGQKEAEILASGDHFLGTVIVLTTYPSSFRWLFSIIAMLPSEA
ncbi:hypothetical protein [Pseudomonas sp.]